MLDTLPPSASSVLTTYPPAATPQGTGPSTHQVQRDADDTAALSAAQLLEVYHYLYLVRRLEEQLVALYRQNHVVGGVYRSLGQEATAVGCTYGMQDGDLVQPLIRDLGAAVVHGVKPVAIMRQYMARGTSPTAGRDLNVHICAPEQGIIGPISMLGTSVPVLVGSLLAAQLRGEPTAGLAFIGDGGSSTGAFYEGLNFAGVRRLPLVMVIEANQYAYSTPTRAQLPHGDLLCRARGFGVSVVEVDGNDVLACYEATRDACHRGVMGGGPTVLLAYTYRRKGHAEHDNQGYVPAGEADTWARDNDPLDRFRSFLLDNRHACQTALSEIEQAANAELEEARAIALADAYPAPEQQPLGVFADGHQIFPEANTWFRGGPPRRPTRDVTHA